MTTTVFRQEAADPKPRLVSAEAVRQHKWEQQLREQRARDGYKPPVPQPTTPPGSVSAKEARERMIRRMVEGSGA
jgi:hypothetical protein